jgi:hypothetical protein
VLDWTTDAAAVRNVLGEIEADKGNFFSRVYAENPESPILVHDDHDCKCGNKVPFNVASGIDNYGNCGPCPCSCSTREAAFEVINMALCSGQAATAEGTCTFHRHPNSLTATLQGPIAFHPSSQKYFILLTDEDSDCPFHEGNRIPGSTCPYNNMEPPNSFPQPGAVGGRSFFRDELEQTATALLNARASFNAFVDPNKGPSRAQFGDPDKNPDPTAAFDPEAVLASLKADTRTAESLQARLLEGLVADDSSTASYRVFNTLDIAGATGSNFIDQFFSSVANSIDRCANKKRQAEEACYQFSCGLDKQCKSEPQCAASCLTQQCLIDGECYTRYQPNPLNGCQVCDPAVSPTAWTECSTSGLNAAASCVQAVCTAGVCEVSGVCTADCGRCFIDGRCVHRHEVNPADQCLWCEPSANFTSWCGIGLNTPACAGKQFCALPGCDNGVLDEGEEGIDCGVGCGVTCEEKAEVQAMEAEVRGEGEADDSLSAGEIALIITAIVCSLCLLCLMCVACVAANKARQRDRAIATAAPTHGTAMASTRQSRRNSRSASRRSVRYA